MLMREFISRAVKKIPVMNEQQLRRIVPTIMEEFLLLDSMMDSLNTGVILADAAHTIIKSNRAASRILGKNINIGDHINACSGHDALCEFISEVVLRQASETSKEFMISEDNTNRYIEVRVLPLVEEKRIRGTIIMVDDITNKKNEAIQKLRLDNLASLTTAAATVAHEIKNPLAAISIHMQLLRKKITDCPLSNDAQTKKHFSVVSEEIERLNKIVVDFLFAVRPLKCTFERVDINALILDVYNTFEVELEKVHIQPTLTLEADLPSIQGDPRFLRQSLINIIKNAAAAMPSGGELSIKTKSKDGVVLILVSDTGCGIPYEHVQKIFEPYFTTKADGTGLGLPMVYKVLKEHGGDIFVRSEVNNGTEFTIILPITYISNKLLSEKTSNNT